MMKVKKVLGMVLVLLLMLSAVACGEKPSTSNTEKEGDNQKVSIEFFQGKREAVDTFNVLIEKFNERYPNIVIKQNTVPDSGKVLQTRAATNDFPDIYSTWPTSAEYRNYVKNGFIMDVTNEDFIKNSIPEIQKLFEIDGRMYGVPLSMNAAGVIYNKKIFEQAGVEVPRTWDEFIGICDTLKEKGFVPVELMLKDSWTITTFAEAMMGNIVSDEYLQKVIQGEAALVDSKEWKVLSEKVLKICEYGQLDAAGAGYDQGIQDIAAGKAAMILQGLWAIPSIKAANSEVELGTFALPAINNSDEIKVVSGVDVGLNIGAKTKHPDACKQFVAFLTSKENAQQYTNMDKNISAIKGVKLDDPVAAGLAGYFQEGKVFNWPNHFWPAGAGNEFTQLIQEFVFKKDIDEFAAKMDKMLRDIQK